MFKTETIKAKIREKGLTVGSVAERLGVTRTSLSYTINNHPLGNPTIRFTEEIGVFLGFSSFDEYLEMERNSDVDTVAG